MVSERLGHANPAFTIGTYQHVLPGMQADAARTFESDRRCPGESDTVEPTGEQRQETR